MRTILRNIGYVFVGVIAAVLMLVWAIGRDKESTCHLD